MTELLSRQILQTKYFGSRCSHGAWKFEDDGWQYLIEVTLKLPGAQPAPVPAAVTITSLGDSRRFQHTITHERDDRRRFAELAFLLASKLKHDQLKGIADDNVGFLHSLEIVRLNDAHLTKVQKALYSSIGFLYDKSKNTGSGESDFLRSLFTHRDQLWHFICRLGGTGGTVDTEDFVWWLNVRPEDVSFRDSSGSLIDDGVLKKLLDRLFPKSCLLTPTEYRALLKRLDLESPLAAGAQSGLRTGEAIGKSIEVNQDEERPAIKKVSLGSRGEPVSVDQVLEYLRDLAEECAELPYYFPAHLKDDGSGKSAFENIRQIVRVVEDPGAFRKRLEKERERLRQECIYSDALAYSPNTAMPGEDGEEDDDSRWGGAAETIPWDSHASKRFNRATILGEPGCGKSWLLRYEAQRLAREAIDILENNKGGIYDIDLPVLVKLPALARREEDLDDAIVGLIGKGYPGGFRDFVRKQLLSNHGVLLLDAWDEVLPLKRRRQLGHRIHAFARKCQTRILLASRIVGYELAPPPLQQSNELELLAWNWPQIESYVRNWFGAEQGKVSGFLSRLRRHPQFRGLARTPLMLMLLCRTCPEADFPSRRSDLYEACLRGLLRDWQIQDKDRYTRIRLSDGYIDELTEILGEVSLELYEKGMQEFTERDLARMLKTSLSNLELEESHDEILREKATRPRLIERFKDDGVLVSATADGGTLRFLHLTFQEYLAARALASKPDRIDIAMRHVYEPAWNGVLAMLGGMLDRPGPYIAALHRKNREDILWRPFFLAVQAAGEIDRNQLPKKVLDRMATFVRLSYGLTQFTFHHAMARRAIRHHEQIADYLSTHADPESELFECAIEMLGDIGSERAVPVLVKALVHKEDEVRQGAAKALRAISSEQAVPALVGALQDTDADVRYDAFEALTRIRSESAIPALAEMLQGKNPDACQHAVWLLGRIGSEKAIPALVGALLNKESVVRSEAAKALGRIGSEKAIPALAEALQDEEARVSEAAAAALGELGSEQAVPALFEAIQAKERDRSVRLAAAQALGTIGSEEIVPSLVELLQTEDRGIRESAAAALKWIGSDKAVAALFEVLQDECEDVRCWAVSALGRAHPEKAIPALHKAIRDEYCIVPWAAVWALKELGSKETVPILLEVLREGLGIARILTGVVLNDIGSEDLIPAMVELLQDPGYSDRSAVVEALGRTGSQKAIAPLMEALRDKNRYVCETAAKALGEIGSEQAVRSLVETMLNTESELPVRLAAAKALGTIGSEIGIPALAEALQDKEPHMSEAAACALGEIGSKEAIPALVEGLVHEEQNVRQSAAEALGRIGSEKAIPALVEILEDRGAEARWNAVDALDGIDHEKAFWAAMKATPSDAVLYEAAKALGMIGSGQALASLLWVLEHRRFSKNEILAESLMRIRPNEAFQLPIQATQDVDACSGSDRTSALRRSLQSFAAIMDNLADLCENPEKGECQC
jgi:HEAT repeat protein